MTKTMITLSQKLLSKFTGLNGMPVTGRIIPPSDLKAEEIALSNLLPGETFASSSGAQCFSFEYETKTHLAIAISLSDDHIDLLLRESQNEIAFVNPVGSHYLYISEKLSLRPLKLSPSWVEENIAGPAQSDGVLLEVLKESLTPVSVFCLSQSSSVYGSLPYSYIADYICTFETCLCESTAIHSSSIDIIRELFLREKLHFSGQNLFQALAAKSLRHSFLEVYRLLEFTFMLPRVDDLIALLQARGECLNLHLIDFARYCSDKLDWHRQERDSIERIFRDYAQHDLSIINDLVANCKPFSSIAAIPSSSSSDDDINAYAKKVAKTYYSLRNQVVHQFWPNKEHDCDEDDWNALILFTLQSVRWIYEKHLDANPRSRNVLPAVCVAAASP
jgi:hypothetical protein